MYNNLFKHVAQEQNIICKCNSFKRCTKKVWTVFHMCPSTFQMSTCKIIGFWKLNWGTHRFLVGCFNLSLILKYVRLCLYVLQFSRFQHLLKICQTMPKSCSMIGNATSATYFSKRGKGIKFTFSKKTNLSLPVTNYVAFAQQPK